MGVILGIAATAVQAVEMPSIFGTHMVMQRAAKAPVWGWAPTGATITVEFAGQVKKAAADAEGKWKIVLDPLPANSNPEVMSITEAEVPAGVPARGPASVKIEDVLVGDNWLCSGQSNMCKDMFLGFGGPPVKSTDWDKVDVPEIAFAVKQLEEAGNYPTLRFYRVTADAWSEQPQGNYTGAWVVLTPDSARQLSAVAYYFGRRLNQELKIPIGCVQDRKSVV